MLAMTNPEGSKNPEENQEYNEDEAGGAETNDTVDEAAKVAEIPDDDDPTAATAPETETASPGEVDALKAENTELRDRVLRLMAEMENLRRRTEREKADTASYAISNFARDVLAVGDNLERALSAVPGDALGEDAVLKALHEGVGVTQRELNNVLDRHHVRLIEAEGQRFDPNLHQAMFEIDNTEVPAGTVVQVLQSGFLIGERVLRPAMVGVAKGGPRQTATENATAVVDEKADSKQPSGEAAPEPEAGS